MHSNAQLNSVWHARLLRLVTVGHGGPGNRAHGGFARMRNKANCTVVAHINSVWHAKPCQAMPPPAIERREKRYKISRGCAHMRTRGAA